MPPAGCTRLKMRRTQRQRPKRGTLDLVLHSWFACTLGSGNCPAIDDIFNAGDRSGAWRDEKSDQVSDLLRLGGASKRDPAQATHDNPFATLIVRPRLCREAFGPGDMRLPFEPARC